MKAQGKSYLVALVMLRDMETLSMGVKSSRYWHFDIHSDNRVDTR